MDKKEYYKKSHKAICRLLDLLQPFLGQEVIWDEDKDHEHLPYFLERLGIVNPEE